MSNPAQAPGGVSGDGSSETDDDGSSSGETDGDGSSSGSGSGKSRSRSSSSGSRSRSGSSSGGSSSGGSGGDLSPAQRKALADFARDREWYLRIDDRKATVAEVAKVEELIRNPQHLKELRNYALRDPRVYRGRKAPADLDYRQLRNLAGAAILPKNGLHAVYDNFGGDLLAMKADLEKAAEGGLDPFMSLVRSKGGDGRVLEDHPAFADAASWDQPVVATQGMCLQALKRPFYHMDPTTVTGKTARACDAVSPFHGGPVAKVNRTLASCVKIVTDRDDSAIPHCAAVRLLRPELKDVAVIVEGAWMQAVLRTFPKAPAAGLFRGGDIATAGRARNKVQDLAAVEGRTAFVYHGHHQCRALGTKEALESSVRGPLELHRACTNGSPVTEEDVAYGMADLVGAVLDQQVEAQGGATDNDNRRYAELIEATGQGHVHAREKALEVALEISGKVSRTKGDCAAGGTYVHLFGVS